MDCGFTEILNRVPPGCVLGAAPWRTEIDVNGKPNSAFDEALLLSRRRQEDEQVIARYAAGPGRGYDIVPMRAFLQKVRHDLGPRAIICDVAINGQPASVEAWVVSYFFPDEEQTAPLPVSVGKVSDIPSGVVRSTSADVVDTGHSYCRKP